MHTRGRRAQGIRTRKISISVTEDDLKVLSSRARRVHRGNVSAVVHEMVAALRREEALDELLRTLGAGRVTASEMAALRSEVAGANGRSRKRRPAA